VFIYSINRESIRAIEVESESTILDAVSSRSSKRTDPSSPQPQLHLVETGAPLHLTFSLQAQVQAQAPFFVLDPNFSADFLHYADKSLISLSYLAARGKRPTFRDVANPSLEPTGSYGYAECGCAREWPGGASGNDIWET
jgi:hypothetical protein